MAGLLDPDPGKGNVPAGFRSNQLRPKLGEAGFVQIELERGSDDLTPKVADQSCSGPFADVDRGCQQPLSFGVSDPLDKPALLNPSDVPHGHLPVVNHSWRSLTRTGPASSSGSGSICINCRLQPTAGFAGGG